MSLELFLSVIGGVITSILLPVIISSVRTQFAQAVPADVGESAWVRFARIAWPHIRKYLTLLIFSLLTSLLIVAFLGDKLTGWSQAFVVGYAWDSTIQKITQKK
jgi:predicted Na+-dependent transporter